MIIDNVTATAGEDGRIALTTRVHGFTFTHTPGCALYEKMRDKFWDWQDGCDCYLSRITITEINGVTVPQLIEEPRPWWKPQWSLFSFMAGVVVSSLWDWLVPYA